MYWIAVGTRVSFAHGLGEYYLSTIKAETRFCADTLLLNKLDLM